MIEQISDRVFNEAGLVAFLLFLWGAQQWHERRSLQSRLNKLAESFAQEKADVVAVIKDITHAIDRLATMFDRRK